VARLLRMPEVAAGGLAAVLSQWPVAVNTPYAVDDAIATVETDKAVVDVPADAEGVILRTLVAEGAEVEVGAPIALLGDPGERVDDLDALLVQLGASDGSLAGEPAAARGRIFSSPLARRLATEAGLLLSDLTGTGPGGRIVRRDVQDAAARLTAAPPAAAVVSAAPATQPPPPASPTVDVGWVDVPHTRMRRAVAERLTASARDTPHFAVFGTARVDALLDLRRRVNTGSGPGATVNDLVLMAAARAHLAVPAMNVVWTPDAVRTFTGVDIAVAVATEAGLLTPVVRGVQALTLSGLASASRDLVDRARVGRLRQAELEGGTLTVTNLGGLGTESFTAIINPPHAAILAVGAARPEAVVVDGEVRAATVMHLSVSVDHRPVDGVVAARWMAELVALLEDPVRILV